MNDQLKECYQKFLSLDRATGTVMEFMGVRQEDMPSPEDFKKAVAALDEAQKVMYDFFDKQGI